MASLSSNDIYGQSPRNNGGNLDNLVTGLPGEGFLAVGAASGLLTDNAPIDEIPVNKGGSLAGSFKDLWYNRIQVLPSRLDMGSLLSSQTRDVEVWSAFFINTNLLDIVGTNVEGISIGDGPSPPTLFSPLESNFYTVVIDVDGPPAINGSYDFQFDVDSVLLPITGQRLTIIPIPYENGSSEQQAWLTDIHPTVNGETRTATRTKPRMSLSLNYRLSQRDYTNLYALAYSGNEREYAIPLWMDADRIASDLLSGALSISFDTDYKRFEDGGLALLWQSDYYFEAIEIDTVSPTEITLANPTQRDYFGAVYIAPLRRGKLIGKPSLSKQNNGFGTGRLNFTMTENYREPPGSYTQYEGVDVLLDRTFLNSAVSDSVNKDRTTIDNETGLFSTFAVRKGTKEFRTQNWIANGLQAKYELYQFLSSRKGKQKAFYFPSWRNDIVVTSEIGASSTGATIEANNYQGYELDGGRACYIELTDGTVFFRHVNFPADDVIDFGSPLGLTVQPEDIVLFSFMNLLRLNSDTVAFEYNALSATATAPLVTIV